MTSDEPRSSCVVVGATGAIGAGICRALAPNWNVLGVGRSELPEDLSAAGVAGLRADITAPDVGEVIESRLHEQGWDCDGLVIASGIHQVALLAELKIESMEQMLAVNFLGPLAITKALVPAMLSQRRGSIVWISSLRGERGDPGQVAYAASKGAMNASLYSLAREVGRRNVRINVVAPGMVVSPMAEMIAQTRQALVDRSPLGRMADLEELAAAVAWLVGPHSSYVTGTILNVDCGESAAVHQEPVSA
ncbi:MAG: SDR family NAD(P)-dependent oxidoreductase [bacterium]|nr:SDR family NAD(P)-dependent oxidoreductase [bacterium]